jgi:hypothetical protein
MTGSRLYPGVAWDVLMDSSFPVVKRHNTGVLTLHFNPVWWGFHGFNDVSGFEDLIKHTTPRKALHEGIGWCPLCLYYSIPLAWYTTFAMIAPTRMQPRG